MRISFNKCTAGGVRDFNLIIQFIHSVVATSFLSTSVNVCMNSHVVLSRDVVYLHFILHRCCSCDATWQNRSLYYISRHGETQNHTLKMLPQVVVVVYCSCCRQFRRIATHRLYLLQKKSDKLFKPTKHDRKKCGSNLSESLSLQEK